jgi:hypothetical protein
LPVDAVDLTTACWYRNLLLTCQHWRHEPAWLSYVAYPPVRLLLPQSSRSLADVVDLSLALSRCGDPTLLPTPRTPICCRHRGPAALLQAPQIWLITHRCRGPAWSFAEPFICWHRGPSRRRRGPTDTPWTFCLLVDAVDILLPWTCRSLSKQIYSYMYASYDNHII